jgi:hypothetical protein
MEARSTGYTRKEALRWLPIECFADGDVFVGQTLWPVGIRLLDLLNSLYATRDDASSGEFLNFIEISNEDASVETHINKTAITMVALNDEDLGRGVGATGERSFPFVPKSAVAVSVRMDAFIVEGSMHLADEETVQDVLNRDALFLPVTGTTIVTKENRFYANRPFVAVNKRHIISVRVGRPPNT